MRHQRGIPCPIANTTVLSFFDPVFSRSSIRPTGVPEDGPPRADQIGTALFQQFFRLGQRGHGDFRTATGLRSVPDQHIVHHGDDDGGRQLQKEAGNAQAAQFQAQFQLRNQTIPGESDCLAAAQIEQGQYLPLNTIPHRGRCIFSPFLNDGKQSSFTLYSCTFPVCFFHTVSPLESHRSCSCWTDRLGRRSSDLQHAWNSCSADPFRPSSGPGPPHSPEGQPQAGKLPAPVTVKNYPTVVPDLFGHFGFNQHLLL